MLLDSFGAAAVPVAGILDSVPEILGYGFTGLAFLFMFLGFLLLRKLSEREKVEPGLLGTARFYIVMAFLFLLATGGLELYKREVKIYFVLSPQLDKDLGVPSMVYQGTPHPLGDGQAPFLVADGSQITVRLDSLAREIQRLRYVLSAQGRLQASAAAAESDTSSELGLDDPFAEGP